MPCFLVCSRRGSEWNGYGNKLDPHFPEIKRKFVIAWVNATCRLKLPADHEVKFNGNNLARGVYFCRFQGGSMQTRKL